MPKEKDRTPETEGLRHESRVAGLREFRTPSLEAVERRRMQLWFLTTVTLVFVATGVLVLATWTSMGSVVLSAPAMRLGALAIVGVFCAYVIEKELRLWRVTRMLTDERVLIASLTNRLHEVSLLLETGRALSGLLDRSELLDTVLRSACELLDANGGSLMLVEGDELVTVSVRGREEALLAQLDTLLPYVSIDRLFDSRNTDALLAGSGIAFPRFSAYAETIFAYCLKTRWGKTAA